MDAEARFWELCDEVNRLDQANWEASRLDVEVASDCRSYERPMVEIIELVEANPEHREAFVRCFCDLVQWKRLAPMSLVAFCMRRLRFPEIPELIRHDAASHGRMSAYYINHMAHWSSINHAYLDEVWEKAGMWAYYEHERLAAGGKPQDAAPGTSSADG